MNADSRPSGIYQSAVKCVTFAGMVSCGRRRFLRNTTRLGIVAVSYPRVGRMISTRAGDSHDTQERILAASTSGIHLEKPSVADRDTTSSPQQSQAAALFGIHPGCFVTPAVADVKSVSVSFAWDGCFPRTYVLS
ncbi:hypothetical protein [Eastern grey kangaroopox virus]|nr:hypothetical protein KM541_gp021 [Eastern grey kangaroopox virus]ATI21117.1 hypothetical protein [Eastern grey kangaroopox virus]AXK50164.1 hypothetical protein EKPV-NSW-ORF033 [Eastern grey kangaroopox virus]